MSSFKDHFSVTAKAYSAFRPTYPEALFQWLATLPPRRELAVDCGCGNGQASVMLARHFARVAAWGDAATLRSVSWPLVLRVGEVWRGKKGAA